MSIPFIISYSVWLSLLIRLTTSNALKWRFLVKMITCAHFLVLAGWAGIKYGLNDKALFLILGLGCSFLGDLALGLKYKSNWMMGLGFGFFMSAMLLYSSFFGINEVSIWLSIPIFLGLGLIFLNISQSKLYDFKGFGPFVLLYGILLAIMAVTALSNSLLYPSNAAISRTLGALSLFLSDMILMHVYFYTIKKPNQITLYLVLYHGGQCLIALSLWLI